MREKKKMFTYALFANLASAFVTFLVTFFIPKYFGTNVREFGLQQIFVFYTGYIGLFHFGLCDGLYLRDGGKSYQELPKHIYSGQFRLLSFLTIIEAVIIMSIFFIYGSNSEYVFIALMVSINIIIQILYTYFSYIMQATGLLKYYAMAQTMGSIIYAVLLMVLFFIKIVNYKLIIIVYTVSQLFILLFYMYRCRDIIFAKPSSLKLCFKEATTNIKIGCQLLIANIAANLITGIAKFGIQMNWDVATYGKISLTISLSNILLLFVSAVSMVLYPILRREKADSYSSTYSKLRNLLMLLLFGGMIFYYPLSKIAYLWLPQYSQGLKYMALLFPICCYSAKMSMLVVTYMKVMRLERKILFVNIITVVISCFTTIISCVLLKNLTIAMLSIVFCQMIRCIIAELLLSKSINYNPKNDIIVETIMTILFMIFSWTIKGLFGLILYIILYIIYMLIYRKKIKEIMPLIHGIFKK